MHIYQNGFAVHPPYCQPSCLSSIVPDLFLRLLSLLACLSMHSLREMVLSWHLIIHNVKFALSFYDNGFNMNKCNFLLFSFHFLVVTFPLMSIPSSAYYHVIQIITNYCKPITNTLQYQILYECICFSLENINIILKRQKELKKRVSSICVLSEARFIILTQNFF